MSISEARRDERVLITHLTRMKQNNVCMAGQTRDGQQVRPLRGGGSDQWTRGHLSPDGLFQIGNVIVIPELSPPGPHLRREDWTVGRESLIESSGRVSAKRFWSLLKQSRVDDLGVAFDGTLSRTPSGSLFVHPPAHGPTLGTVPLRDPTMDRSRQSNPRIAFEDDALGRVNLPLTDIRAFDVNNEPNREVLDLIERRFDRGLEVIACVGLTHPWARTSDRPSEAEHWLQLNNLHFRGDLDLKPM